MAADERCSDLAAGDRKDAMERTLGDAHAACGFCLIQVQQVAETQCLHLVGSKDMERTRGLRTQGLHPFICTALTGNLSSWHVISWYDMNIYSFRLNVNIRGETEALSSHSRAWPSRSVLANVFP